MGRINYAWSGALIIFAIIMVSTQCLSNPETYTGALLKCSQFKTMSERNMCRAEVTKRYRNFMDEVPYHRQYRKVTAKGYILEDEDVH